MAGVAVVSFNVAGRERWRQLIVRPYAAARVGNAPGMRDDCQPTSHKGAGVTVRCVSRLQTSRVTESASDCAAPRSLVEQ